MLLFAPASSFASYYQPTIDPRDRYIAALAEARSAEAEYLAFTREQAIQSQRAEEAFLRRQRDQAIRRRLLLSSLYEQGSFYPADHYSYFSSLRRPFASEYREAEERERSTSFACCQQQEQEGRLLAAYRARQEEGERRRLAILRQKQEDKMRTCRLHRQHEVGLKRKEQARKEKEHLEYVLHFLGGPRAVAENKEQRQAPPQPQLPSKPEAAKPSEVGTSHPNVSTLKAQLEERLGNEYSNEVRDTIHAVLASLFHPQPTATPSNSPAAPETNDAKGKRKAVHFDVSPGPPTPNDIVHSIDEVKNIEAHFLALESDFVFPRSLDFSPASPAASDTDSAKLAYSSLNAPIHNYTHALSLLLAQLDAVESYGNEDVRGRRKEVVIKVEGALEDVERIIEEKGQLSRRASRESLSKGEEVVSIEEREKKSAAKEWLAAKAFKSESGSQDPTPSHTGVSSHVGNVASTDSVEDSQTPVVRGYDVEDNAPTATPLPPVDETDSHIEMTFAHPLDNSFTTNPEVPQHEPAMVADPVHADTHSVVEPEADSTLTQPVDKDVSGSVSTATDTAPSSVNSPTLVPSAVPEPQEQVNTFLLHGLESPDSPLDTTSVPLDDVVVVDEGSDWSEVDA